MITKQDIDNTNVWLYISKLEKKIEELEERIISLEDCFDNDLFDSEEN